MRADEKRFVYVIVNEVNNSEVGIRARVHETALPLSAGVATRLSKSPTTKTVALYWPPETPIEITTRSSSGVIASR